jgi:hypothetical protein
MIRVSPLVPARAGALLLGVASAAVADGAIKQTVDVLGQGLSGACAPAARQVAAAEGASLVRTRNGITASVSMPAPPPGTYCYPPANPFQTIAPTPGTPEVFTGWFFFFNYPENCATPNACVPAPPGSPAPNDFTRARGGVYNFAGHAISGGGTLNLVGHIEVGEPQFDGPFALENPAGAEVHLAIAPHGVVIPELLPDQINTPVGSPPYWWVGLFNAPSAP